MPRSDAIAGAALRHVRRLYNAGSAAGLDDAELLDRFAVDRDQGAFAALLDRHGPMVLATCRSLLHDAHDADDAFQATFLVLSRRAGTFRVVGHSLGGWLHGVALRVAARARADRARLQARRSSAAVPDVAIRDAGADRDDLIAALHRELGRLPERYRSPVMLCYLEGRTHAQAAAVLGKGEATVRRRLAEAKALLRSRLERRGIAPAVTLSAMMKVGRASAEVPEALVAATSWAVRGLAIGRGVVGASAAATALAGAAIRASAIVRLAQAVAIAVAIAAAAGLATITIGADPEAEPSVAGASPPAPAATVPEDGAERPQTAEPTTGDPEPLAWIAGRVVGPDGEPVAGARVNDEIGLEHRRYPRPEPAVTGPDGRFVLTMTREGRDEMLREERWARIVVYAWADGYARSRSETVVGDDGPFPVEIRLAEGGPPIAGRIVDLEGRPVAGATVMTTRVYAPIDGDLGPWVEHVRSLTDRDERDAWSLEIDGRDSMTTLPINLGATTGPDGRFRIDEIGEGRVAQLMVSGPTIAGDTFFAITADVEPFRVVKESRYIPTHVNVYYGRQFEHAAAPTKPIVGTVRDAETGAPLAGVRIGGNLMSAQQGYAREGAATVTDEDGRYRLAGLPVIEPTDRYLLFIDGPAGGPYLNAMLEFRSETPALQPLPFDFELRRGVVVRGRITDKVTGEPVPGSVSYYAMSDNPHVDDFAGFRHYGDPSIGKSDAEGRFEVVALPGRGFIAARTNSLDYVTGVGDPAILELTHSKQSSDEWSIPAYFNPNNYEAIEGLDLEAGLESADRDLQVDPGRTIAGTIVDPDGLPLSGVEARFLEAFGYGSPRTLPSAEFEARGVDPRSPRRAFFVHRGRQLAGTLLLDGGREGPMTVAMVPWGVLTGRVVDDQGEPMTGIELDDYAMTSDPARFDPDRGDVIHNGEHVDAEGRFRLEGLVPGLDYSCGAGDVVVTLGKIYDGVTVEPGEVKDLGDVRIVGLGE